MSDVKEDNRNKKFGLYDGFISSVEIQKCSKQILEFFCVDLYYFFVVGFGLLANNNSQHKCVLYVSIQNIYWYEGEFYYFLRDEILDKT